MLIKQKSLSLPRSLALWTFDELLIDKSAISCPFNSLNVLSSISDKAKLFPESFSQSFSLNDSGISLSAFPSRTDLQLHNISVTPKMVKKAFTCQRRLVLIVL